MNPIGIVNFAELFLLEDGKPVELAFETFFSMVLDLRESNTATVKDVMNLWMNIKTSPEVQERPATAQSIRPSPGRYVPGGPPIST